MKRVRYEMDNESWKYKEFLKKIILFDEAEHLERALTYMQAKSHDGEALRIANTDSSNNSFVTKKTSTLLARCARSMKRAVLRA
eukprot:SAG11_NODE_2962_length_2807_cov_9.931315_3_plen_84_part_00